MQDELFDLRMKISKYEDILREIASASEQANPKHLIDRAKMTLSFYAEEDKEPTTADEFNQQDMLDRHRDMEAQLAKYDKKLSEDASEAAESVWRSTVLHPDYKSEYEEEE